jgi:hypothetical protein
MFSKRKIQAAQARPPQSVGKLADTSLTFDRRPRPLSPPSKDPGRPLKGGITGSQVGERLEAFKRQLGTAQNVARKGMTGVNTTTDADMRGIGKLVRQPVPPQKLRNLLSNASKTASGLKKNPPSFRNVPTSEMPRGAMAAPKIVGALAGAPAKRMMKKGGAIKKVKKN